MCHPLPVTAGSHQPSELAIQHHPRGQTNFSPMFHLQEVRAVLTCLLEHGFKIHHQEGVPPQAAISAVVPSIKLFRVSNLKVLCCSFRPCREVFTLLFMPLLPC